MSSAAPNACAAPRTDSSELSDWLSVSMASTGVSGAISCSRPASTRPGPTSMARSAPSAAAAAAWWKRTGNTIWSRSSTRRSVPGSSTSPVTVDTIERVGSAKVNSASRSVIASDAG